MYVCVKVTIENSNKRKFYVATGEEFPRTSVIDGFELPSSRAVSEKMTQLSGITQADTAARFSQEFSLLMMQFGQMLDHDIAHTPAPSDGGFFPPSPSKLLH